MSELSIISAADIEKYATREMAFSAVRRALIAITEPDSMLFPVSIGRGLPTDSMVAVKSGLSAPEGIVGLKVGTYWPDNAVYGLANHGSSTLLLDPKTGMPTALFNAVALNGLRTAAANAVATDALARSDARVLLVVGAGHQARCEVAALCDIRTISRVLVWSRNPDHARIMVEEMSSNSAIQFVAVTDLKSATREADIITTVTPSTKALIQSEWVQPGTHISAMGADKRGKKELDPQLMKRAMLFADYPPQSVEIGEFQHAVGMSLVQEKNITAIGDVLSGVCKGRENDGSITVFDSSGIALQDIAVALAILDEIRLKGRVLKAPF